jgi:AcrR family transcriptional regulator
MKLRADAQRNLDRLLEAAGECFAEQGVDASIDEIARRAGVGHGTVFRRFPTKEALLAAILAGHMLELTNAAEASYAETDAGEAFDSFVRRVAEAYARNRVLLESVKRCEMTPEVDGLVDAVGRLLQRAQDAGAVRTDVSAEDVLALIPTASSYPDIVLDGLRPPVSSDLSISV